MRLPRIVSGSDTLQRLRCKFEHRRFACLFVPPGGCSRSCQDAAASEDGERMAFRSSTALLVPPVRET
jgi:hypothetical protein